MPGANYMGGKRNSARTRARDVASKIQKGHFMKQRHQTLTRGLQESNQDTYKDADSYSKIRTGRIEDITLLAARRHSGRSCVKPSLHEVDERSHTKPTLRSTLLPSSSPEPSRERIRRSRMLEALDTEDAIALRRTMNRLLCIPDLAGLGKIDSDRSLGKNSKRRNEPTTTTMMQESPLKKQKTIPESSSSNKRIFSWSPVPERPLLYSRTRQISTPLTTSGSELAPECPTSDNSAREVGKKTGSYSSIDDYSVNQELDSAYSDSGFEELLFTEDTDGDSVALYYDKRSGYLRHHEGSNSLGNTSDLSRLDSADLSTSQLNHSVNRDYFPEDETTHETQICAPSSPSDSELPQGTDINLLDYSDPLLALYNIIDRHMLRSPNISDIVGLEQPNSDNSHNPRATYTAHSSPKSLAVVAPETCTTMNIEENSMINEHNNDGIDTSSIGNNFDFDHGMLSSPNSSSISFSSLYHPPSERLSPGKGLDTAKPLRSPAFSELQPQCETSDESFKVMHESSYDSKTCMKSDIISVYDTVPSMTALWQQMHTSNVIALNIGDNGSSPRTSLSVYNSNKSKHASAMPLSLVKDFTRTDSTQTVQYLTPQPILSTDFYEGPNLFSDSDVDG